MIIFPFSNIQDASDPARYRLAVTSADDAGLLAPAPVEGKRRSQEDRSRGARERLLAAAIDVLFRKGYGGLTTKEVASCAQMSNGALMHHFVSKEELVVAATSAVYQGALRLGQRRAATAQARSHPIESFVHDCLSIYFDWPFIAALEIIIVARTDPALMARIIPVMEEYRRMANLVWLGVFVDAGMPDAAAERVLNLTLNLVRGMAVNNLWQKNQELYKRQLEDWIGLMYSNLPAK